MVSLLLTSTWFLSTNKLFLTSLNYKVNFCFQGSFQQMWISKQEYDEGGKNCVEKKCPWFDIFYGHKFLKLYECIYISGEHEVNKE